MLWYAPLVQAAKHLGRVAAEEGFGPGLFPSAERGGLDVYEDKKNDAACV